MIEKLKVDLESQRVRLKGHLALLNRFREGEDMREYITPTPPRRRAFPPDLKPSTICSPISDTSSSLPENASSSASTADSFETAPEY